MILNTKLLKLIDSLEEQIKGINDTFKQIKEEIEGHPLEDWSYPGYVDEMSMNRFIMESRGFLDSSAESINESILNVYGFQARFTGNIPNKSKKKDGDD